MSIKRYTPDVGYLDPARLAGAGVAQIVRAKDTVYLSGIVAASGDGACVAPEDMGRQLAFILGVLDKCLHAEELSLRNLVVATIYCTDIERLSQHAHLFKAAFGDHPPTMNWIEVRSLSRKDYLAELVAIAVAD